MGLVVTSNCLPRQAKVFQITQHDIENTTKMGMEPWAKHGIGENTRKNPYVSTDNVLKLDEVYFWTYGAS